MALRKYQAAASVSSSLRGTAAAASGCLSLKWGGASEVLSPELATEAALPLVTGPALRSLHCRLGLSSTPGLHRTPASHVGLALGAELGGSPLARLQGSNRKPPANSRQPSPSRAPKCSARRRNHSSTWKPEPTPAPGTFPLPPCPLAPHALPRGRPRPSTPPPGHPQPHGTPRPPAGPTLPLHTTTRAPPAPPHPLALPRAPTSERAPVPGPNHSAPRARSPQVRPSAGSQGGAPRAAVWAAAALPPAARSSGGSPGPCPGP